MLRRVVLSACKRSVTMRVYLIHHAHAVDAPPGAKFLDDLRALTPAGRKSFARTARAFAERGEGIESLRSSPALRAVETAELLAAELKNACVAVLEELRPGAAAVPVRDWLLEQRHAAIALVGHGRQLRDLARLLVGPERPFALKKGSIVRLDLKGRKASPRWSLRDPEDAVGA
jgi:phosphohistidine phosphatase